uniref:Beta/delta-theraphotoxin-Pre1a n=1 Tax=Psalmopoeus reduncus TaxID=1795668 RepID=NTA_PSARE|nr:RecName: Full=Beta/delta-theraphotoxin-Pre1a; Short=Beta/delta-TRTX-Pre1a [Psalmopoeus reduncus]
EDCLGWFSRCSPKNDKCCPNYKCSSKDLWCKYKIW